MGEENRGGRLTGDLEPQGLATVSEGDGAHLVTGSVLRLADRWRRCRDKAILGSHDSPDLKPGGFVCERYRVTRTDRRV